MKSFFSGGGEEALAQDVLRIVFGQLQVVDARVDRRVAAVAGRVHLADDGEARVEVGQAARRQRRAARGELQERLALLGVHLDQHVDESLQRQIAVSVALRKPKLTLTNLTLFQPSQTESNLT